MNRRLGDKMVCPTCVGEGKVCVSCGRPVDLVGCDDLMGCQAHPQSRNCSGCNGYGLVSASDAAGHHSINTGKVCWCGFYHPEEGKNIKPDQTMKTPLQVLTEVIKRIKARRAVYQGEARRLTDAGFRTRAVDNAMQAASMKEALDIIKDVEQGAEIHQ